MHPINRVVMVIVLHRGRYTDTLELFKTVIQDILNYVRSEYLWSWDKVESQQ